MNSSEMDRAYIDTALFGTISILSCEVKGAISYKQKRKKNKKGFF